MARRPLPFDPVAEARAQWVARGWSSAADGMAAVTSVMRAQQLLLSRVEDVLRPFGLTFSRFEVLTLLSFTRTGALPMSKLGERLQVHPTSVTNAVDRLERQDLVRRRPHPDDRRAVLAEITDAGRELAASAAEALNEAVFTDPGLGPQGVGRVIDVLTDLRRSAGDF